ncbi:MAG: hypothetical protein N3E45_14070, partial [Oscillatoriaceae bacterium SKW80]|nr:hypothetical protein [Oscillatoriaceae bacterium SKW80]
IIKLIKHLLWHYVNKSIKLVLERAGGWSGNELLEAGGKDNHFIGASAARSDRSSVKEVNQ